MLIVNTFFSKYDSKYQKWRCKKVYLSSFYKKTGKQKCPKIYNKTHHMQKYCCLTIMQVLQCSQCSVHYTKPLRNMLRGLIQNAGLQKKCTKKSFYEGSLFKDIQASNDLHPFPCSYSIVERIKCYDGSYMSLLYVEKKTSYYNKNP